MQPLARTVAALVSSRSGSFLFHAGRYQLAAASNCLSRHKSSQVQLQTEGSSPAEVSDPLQHEDFFGVRDLVSVRDLFDARVHLGHKNGLLHPYMKQYIFGSRLGVDIIDLEQSVKLLGEALNVAAHIAYREGIIMFLTRHPQTAPLVERTAQECGEYAHCQPWRRGIFTNAGTLFGAVTRLPDLMVFLNTHDSVFEQHLGVVEAAKLNIPSVAIVDSASDPRLITYPIPGNDDSLASIDLYCNLFKTAIMKGKVKRKEMLKASGEDGQ